MIDSDDEDKLSRRQENSRLGGLRHDVITPARIEGSKGGSIDATIDDVSSAGMSLRLPMSATSTGVEILPVGSKVTVVFAPDHAFAPDNTVRLPAVVARRHPPVVGVQFANLTKEEQHALRTLAVLAVQSRGFVDDLGVRSASERDARPIVLACMKVIERRLPNIIWMLRTELATKLRLIRDDPAHGVSGEANKQAADLIEQKATAIGRTIERRVLRTFAELGGLDFTQELVFTRKQLQLAKQQAAAGQEVHLVEEATLESSIAMNATCQRLETSLASQSFEVNVRLANVLRRRIDNIENPLVPAVMCGMLWRSVTDYCESPSVNACLQGTIVKNIMPLIAELYEAIGTVLDEHRVPSTYWTGDAKD